MFLMEDIDILGWGRDVKNENLDLVSDVET